MEEEARKESLVREPAPWAAEVNPAAELWDSVDGGSN